MNWVKKLAVSVKQQCLLEVNRDKLELFSAEYTDTLKSALEGEEATPQPQAVDREHSIIIMILRQNKLTDLWRKLLHSIGCTSATEEPLFMEYVNEVH